MEPNVYDLFEKNNTLTFTVNNINVSYANAIRRTIISDIESIVFITLPHEKNKSNFYINTTKFNNEILKQRLACIPIHISDLEMPIDDYLLEVNVKNTTDNLVIVTTNDFNIKNIKTNEYLSKEIVNQIFPPDKITKQYIDFCRLSPNYSTTVAGEHIKFDCKFSISTASENSSYNVVSSCAYKNTPDLVKIEEQQEIKLNELKQKYDNQEDIDYIMKDWNLLDSKRIYINDSFDFTIESVGVYENKIIVKKAIDYIIKKLKIIKETYSTEINLIKEAESTIPNSYNIYFENEGYTIGKIIEYCFYKNYFEEKKTLSFCAFNKPHPHINISIIKIAFNDPVEKKLVNEYLVNSCNQAITFLEKLNSQF